MLNKSEVRAIEKIKQEMDGLRRDVNNVIDSWRELENVARKNVEESIRYGLKIDGLKEKITNLSLNGWTPIKEKI